MMGKGTGRAMAGSDEYVEMSATCFLEANSRSDWDSIKGSDSKYKAFCLGEDGVMDVVNRCHKFFFGKDDSVDEPALLGTAMDFIKNGINILPYPECWAEWDISVEVDGTRDDRFGKRICLVRQVNEKIWFQQFALAPGGCSRAVLSDPARWRMSSFVLTLDRYGEIEWFRCHDGNIAHLREPFSSDHRTMQLALASFASLLAKETKLIEKHPPSGLAAHRAKKGKVPFFSHHVVTIDPERIVYEGGDGSQPGGPKRTSPRLHWRRGHVRTLSSGKKIGIPPSIIGAKNGRGGPVIDKTYRVRTDHDSRSVATGTETDSARDEAGVAAG